MSVEKESASVLGSLLSCKELAHKEQGISSEARSLKQVSWPAPHKHLFTSGNLKGVLKLTGIGV